MKIVSCAVYWGEITRGSVVWAAGPNGIREGTVADMRATMVWPSFALIGPCHKDIAVDLDLASGERLMGVPLSELHPTHGEAQHAYTRIMIREIVREELAKQKENTNG